MNPLSLRKTDTTKFILPMVFDESIKYDKILTTGFEDTYIAIYNNPIYDDHITITHTGEYNGFYLVQTEPKKILLEDETVFVIFDIPEQWADDFVKILQGEYSKLSEEYKQHLLNFWGEGPESSLYKGLYFKTSNVRDRDLELVKGYDFRKITEAWSAPDIRNEIYGLGAF